jgi:hypothetical protein
MFQAIQAVGANFRDSIAYGVPFFLDNDLSCFPDDQLAFDKTRPRNRTPHL